MSTTPKEPIFDDGVLPAEPSTSAGEPIIDTPISPAQSLTPPPARRQRSRVGSVLIGFLAGALGSGIVGGIAYQQLSQKTDLLSNIVYSQTEIPFELRSDLEIGNFDKKEPSNTLNDLVANWHDIKSLRQLNALTTDSTQKNSKTSYNGCKDLKADADSVRELLGRYSSLPGDELNEPTLRALGNRTIISMTRLLDQCAANITNKPYAVQLAKTQKELEEVKAEITELGKTCDSAKQTAASPDGTNQTSNSGLAATPYVTAPCLETCPPAPTCLQTTCPVIDVKTTEPYFALQTEYQTSLGQNKKLGLNIITLEKSNQDLKDTKINLEQTNDSLEQRLRQAQSTSAQNIVSDCPEYMDVDCETEPLSNGAEVGIATYGTAVKRALECKDELEQTKSELTRIVETRPVEAIPVDAPVDPKDLDDTLANGASCPEPIVCPEVQNCPECPPTSEFNLERECYSYHPADTNKDEIINADDLTCMQIATEYLKAKPTTTPPPAAARTESTTSQASYDCTSQGGIKYNDLGQMCRIVGRLFSEINACESKATAQPITQPRDDCAVDYQAQVNERYQKLKSDIQAHNTTGVMKSIEEVVCAFTDRTAKTPTIGGIFDFMFVDLKGVSVQEVQETRKGFVNYIQNANPQLREQANGINGDIEYKVTCKN